VRQKFDVTESGHTSDEDFPRYRRGFAVLKLGVATSVTMALAADIKAGEAVYQKACKSCHGADGTANLSLAKMLKADIKDRKSPEVQSMSVADIKKAVTRAKAR